MALLRNNQPALVVMDGDAPLYVESYVAPDIVNTTRKRKLAMQATWRNLRDARRDVPGAVFKSDLDPNA